MSYDWNPTHLGIVDGKINERSNERTNESQTTNWRIDGWQRKNGHRNTAKKWKKNNLKKKRNKKERLVRSRINYKAV